MPRGTSLSFVKIHEVEVEKKDPESAEVTGSNGESAETTWTHSFITLDEGKTLNEYGIGNGSPIFRNQDPNGSPTAEEEEEKVEEIEEWTVEESDGMPNGPPTGEEEEEKVEDIIEEWLSLQYPRSVLITNSSSRSDRQDIFYNGNRLRVSFSPEDLDQDVELNGARSNITGVSSNVNSAGASYKIRISLSLISAPDTRVSDTTVSIVFASNVTITQIEPRKSITNGMESEVHVGQEKKYEVQGSISSSSLIPVEVSTGIMSSDSTQYEYTRKTKGMITGDGVGTEHAYWVMKEDPGVAGRNGLDSHIEMSVVVKVDGHEKDRPVIVKRRVDATFVKGTVGTRKRFWNSKTVTLSAKSETGLKSL